MIRLREGIQNAVSHPLLGPLVLVLLALLLAFVALHAVEDGLAGALFACAFAAVAVLRIVARPVRTVAPAALVAATAGRAPPRRRFGHAIHHSPPAALLSTPLRR